AEQHERDRQELEECFGALPDPYIVQEGKVEIPEPSSVARVPEREAEDDARPENREDPHGEVVLHEHAEHVLASDHAAVEEGKARSHEQHQRGRDENPAGISRVHVASLGRCVTTEGSMRKIAAMFHGRLRATKGSHKENAASLREM